MNKLLFIDKITPFIKKFNKEIIIFLIFYIILFVNSFHETYPDEMDNVLGGLLINKGHLPYTGFFTHHGPLAYYLASVLTFFSGQSFVKFRVFSAIFYLLLLILTFLIFKKRIKNFNSASFFFYAIVLLVASTYYWLHMFLADPISAYLLIPAYGILFLKIYKNQILEKADFAIISVFSALSLINSPTYTYVVFIIAFFSWFNFLFQNRSNISFQYIFRKTLTFLAIFVIPYFLFLIFLLITKTFSDYYFQALTYNKNYYIYNYPREAGSTSFNPIRYAAIIFNNFFNSYQVLFAAIKNVDFINPINITLALSNLVLWLVLLINKRYFLLLLSILLIIYSNVRSSPLQSGAKDYQSAVYLLLTFFNASFILFNLKDEIKKLNDSISKVLLTGISVVLIIYWFFTSISFFGELWRMSYLRYMGNMPLIYDRPEVANMVNAVVSKDSYCWIGPFDFGEIFYTNCKLPSRFHIIRPPFEKIQNFKNEMISDFAKNKPDVIVYRYKIFSPGREDQFFLDFLDENYVNIKEVSGSKKYRFKNDKSQNYDFTNGVFLENSKQNELTKRLLENGYIEEYK